jgi:SAM-dependent methyltransferase
LGALADRRNASVVTGDLMTMDFGASRFDLVHSRAVLMHLDDPDDVVARVVAALRPGGVVLFEESDGAPAQAAATTPAVALDLPAPFLQVMVPLADRWTWARGLAARLAAEGLVDVRDDVRDPMLRGATPGAAFWHHTLETIRPLLTDGVRMAGFGRDAVDESSVDAMLALLDDAAFTAPFIALHQVSGRRP